MTTPLEDSLYMGDTPVNSYAGHDCGKVTDDWASDTLIPITDSEEACWDVGRYLSENELQALDTCVAYTKDAANEVTCVIYSKEAGGDATGDVTDPIDTQYAWAWKAGVEVEREF